MKTKLAVASLLGREFMGTVDTKFGRVSVLEMPRHREKKMKTSPFATSHQRCGAFAAALCVLCDFCSDSLSWFRL